jgi:hypothetical protein
LLDGAARKANSQHMRRALGRRHIQGTAKQDGRCTGKKSSLDGLHEGSPMSLKTDNNMAGSDYK